MPEVAPPAPPPSVVSIAVDGLSPGLPAATITTGDSLKLSKDFNTNAAKLCILAAAINGAYSIVQGLVVSEGLGLNVNVSGGQAIIGGLVEVGNLSGTCAASAINWVWLQPNGSLYVGLEGDAPDPAGLLLAAVTCNATQVTAIDRTSVFEQNGGLPVRHSGDAFKPTDSPTAKCIHLVKTSTATWMWDGNQYCLMVPASAIGPLSTSASIADLVTYLRDLGLATS